MGSVAHGEGAAQRCWSLLSGSGVPRKRTGAPREEKRGAPWGPWGGRGIGGTGAPLACECGGHVGQAAHRTLACGWLPPGTRLATSLARHLACARGAARADVIHGATLLTALLEPTGGEKLGGSL